MPNETFLNLSDEKKVKLEMILLEKFYNRHASQVKVSEIVEAMHMSRGAFYKYFRDLEDAYTYMTRKYSTIIHVDILKFIDENKNDFFGGIEKYLFWCSNLDHNSDYWRGIQFLTQETDLVTYRRKDFPAESFMMKQWMDLLELNKFKMESYEEAVSFLYFVMSVVMGSLKDYIANDWSKEKLVKDFRFKSHWLTKGIK